MSVFVPNKKKTGQSTRTSTGKKGKKAAKPRDNRLVKLVGVTLVLIGLCALVACISYLMTWKTDQDKILNNPFAALGEGDLKLENWLGRLGAVAANGLIYWGFGLPAIIIPLLVTGFGLRKFVGASLSTWYMRAGKSFVLMVYLSMFLSFVFARFHFPWGGSFGKITTLWLGNFMGFFGLLLFLVFIPAVAVVIRYNPSANWNGEIPVISPWLRKLKERAELARARAAEELKAATQQESTDDNDWLDVSGSEEKSSGLRTTKTTKASQPEEELALEYDDDSYFEEEEEEVEDVEEEEEMEAMDLEIQELVSTPGESDCDQPELEITEGNDPLAIADQFAEGHVPPTFSGVESKVFLMDQESEDHSEPYDPTLELSSYVQPELELLAEYSDGNIQIDRAEVEANKDQIIETLLNYKIEITKIRATIGPTVTLYEIIPKPGIRISRIKSLEDDIALSLSALGIRIIAPIPGKGTIGIEVPNKRKQIVSLKEVLASEKFTSGKMDLPIALGKTISNEVFVADLAKMPHLLIAGATGQGKSVGINAVLMSLLYRKHPSQLKLVLIDPKKVELFPYTRLENHFLAFLPDQQEPIVTETKKVIHTLNSLCIEMDDRYDLLKKAHARNLKEYNEKFVNRQLNPQKGHRFMPFIVLVIDEFADLIMTAGKEVEMPIARLAQLARAVGIHLIIATQRPSVNIITGVIKANFPARLAYKVASKVDSRTILDTGGAEQLIGQGDMLLSIGSNMIRLQCAFVDTPEVEHVINHISRQKGYPEPYFLPEYVGDDEPIQGADGMTYADLDDMFEDAARLVIQNQHGSTSMIQRRLKLGYNRAGRIMDQLESLGVVGAAEGSKPRDVLMFTESDLDALISRMRNK